MSPGRLLYLLWHKPRAEVRQSLTEGGPLEQWRTWRGRIAMERAAWTLPVPAPGDGRPLVLHLLTGRRFWFQTAFCLWTFAHTSRRNLAPVIIDDGSLETGQADALRRLFPAAKIRSNAENTARLDDHLPRARFPVLRARIDTYPLLRKLTDPHVGQTGWKLLIDSDLLFFRRPALLVDWLDAPTQPLRAADIQNAYGYPLPLLAALAGRPVPECVNTGLIGLRSEEIDWEKQEYWCRTLIERQGTHYYQEQALVALLLAGRPHLTAPAADYVTLPRPPEATDCRAVMHHYVADSKRWYFRRNWQRVLSAGTGPAAPTP
jgi:hypothetical protein